MNQKKKKIVSHQRPQIQPQLQKKNNDLSNEQEVSQCSSIHDTGCTKNKSLTCMLHYSKMKCLKIQIKKSTNNNNNNNNIRDNVNVTIRKTLSDLKAKEIKSYQNVNQIQDFNVCDNNPNINNHCQINQIYKNKNLKNNIKSSSSESNINKSSKIPMPSLTTINLIKKTLERAVKNSEEFLHTNSFSKCHLSEVCSKIFKIKNKISKSSILSLVETSSSSNNETEIKSISDVASFDHFCAREMSNTEGFGELKSKSTLSSKQPRNDSYSKGGFTQLKKQKYMSLQHRNKLIKAAEILQPGPGILKRAQQAEMTLTGLAIIRSEVNRLLTFEEQKLIRQNPNTVKRIKLLMEEPYNEMSNILDHLGLTGLGGMIQERILQLKYPVKCLINVTYESPLIKLPGWEVYRIPVADDKKENLSIYFDELAEKIEQMKYEQQSTIVHCMVGVSRSATMILAYLIRYYNMTTKEAFKHVKNIRPFINPNIAFLEQLVYYEWKCFKNSPEFEMKKTKMQSITLNDVTKVLPDFIINDYLEEYKHEFVQDDEVSPK